MNYHLNVRNIQSDGCANTICSTLDALDGVNQTVVNVTNGAVIVNADEDVREAVGFALLELGYPEIDHSRFHNTFGIKLKSLISCVKGRLNIDRYSVTH